MGPGVWRSCSVFNVLSRTHYTDYTLQETCISLESDMDFKRTCCCCLNSYLLWKFFALASKHRISDSLNHHSGGSWR